MRHSIGSILALAAAAVVAGAQSFTAIGEWAADAPQPVLAALGTRFDPRQARYAAPDEATVRRVAGRVDGDLLDDVISNWLAHRDTSTTDPAETPPAAIAVDGKPLRGTFARTGGAGVHLLAAITHNTATVLGQRQVPAGNSEITWFQPLLDTIDLTGRVVTGRRPAHHRRTRPLPALPRRGPRFHRQGEPTPSPRPARHPALARNPRPHHQRQRPRPQRTPHHPARTPGQVPRLPGHRLPPRHARVPHRALHHPPHQPQTLRPRRSRPHQPHRPLRPPRPHRRLRPQPLAHRKQTPLGPRRHTARNTTRALTLLGIPT
ncbi:transposase [Amycolatopsis mediterranei RB]|nr:transposase [Amycolatopsis mediterranei RB]